MLLIKNNYERKRFCWLHVSFTGAQRGEITVGQIIWNYLLQFCWVPSDWRNCLKNIRISWLQAVTTCWKRGFCFSHCLKKLRGALVSGREHNEPNLNTYDKEHCHCQVLHNNKLLTCPSSILISSTAFLSSSRIAAYNSLLTLSAAGCSAWRVTKMTTLTDVKIIKLSSFWTWKKYKFEAVVVK
jgi:hypothetical protein